MAQELCDILDVVQYGRGLGTHEKKVGIFIFFLFQNSEKKVRIRTFFEGKMCI